MVCNQHGSRPACTSAQSDQDPCCSLTNPITSREINSVQHGSLSDCADAQAGLDPYWSQTHYVGFVMAWLLYYIRITLGSSGGSTCTIQSTAGISNPLAATSVHNKIASFALQNWKNVCVRLVCFCLPWKYKNSFHYTLFSTTLFQFNKIKFMIVRGIF
jgi:hypothetical protein